MNTRCLLLPWSLFLVHWWFRVSISHLCTLHTEPRLVSYQVMMSGNHLVQTCLGLQLKEQSKRLLYAIYVHNPKVHNTGRILNTGKDLNLFFGIYTINRLYMCTNLAFSVFWHVCIQQPLLFYFYPSVIIDLFKKHSHCHLLTPPTPLPSKKENIFKAFLPICLFTFRGVIFFSRYL